MSIITLIFLIIAIAYVLLYFVLFIGTLRSYSMKKQIIPEEDLPFTSVIVSAKNEEEIISECMDALVNLDYPLEKLEIFMVDNDSVDRTGEIMQSYADKYEQIKFLKTDPNENHLRGKTQAIHYGILNSRGEIIFTTDADCCVHPKWLKETVSFYEKDTGVVNNFTLMEPVGFFAGIQSLDWLYMLLLCSSSSGLGKPISCVGNNMSYRRKSYDEVGGYEKIPFSVTEDFMLQKQIDLKTNWKCKFTISRKSLNISKPCKTISDISRQKHRWGVGGLNMRPWGVIIGVVSWLGAISLLTGWLFLSWQAYVTFAIIKLAVDALYYSPAVNEFRMYKLYLYFIPFQIYMPLYSTILFLSLLFNRRVYWKKERYN